MPMLSLIHLRDHPEHANRMSDARLATLTTHLGNSGRCPALIVRALGRREYQIIDGHQRVRALKALGRDRVSCDLWDADDDQTRLLLLTLNRLRGVDDPQQRGRLIKTLAKNQSPRTLARKLPEDTRKINRLIDLTTAPPRPKPPPRPANLPHPLTFFLTSAQRSRVIRALGAHCRDRTEALMTALGVDANSTPITTKADS